MTSLTTDLSGYNTSKIRSKGKGAFKSPAKNLMEVFAHAYVRQYCRHRDSCASLAW